MVIILIIIVFIIIIIIIIIVVVVVVIILIIRYVIISLRSAASCHTGSCTGFHAGSGRRREMARDVVL